MQYTINFVGSSDPCYGPPWSLGSQFCLPWWNLLKSSLSVRIFPCMWVFLMMFMVVDRPGKKNCATEPNLTEINRANCNFNSSQTESISHLSQVQFHTKMFISIRTIHGRLSQKTELNHSNILEVLNWKVSYTPNWTVLDWRFDGVVLNFELNRSVSIQFF